MRFSIVILLTLGIFFRFFNLEYKVYWHDEAYTSMRAAGFTREEIDRELFQNRIIPAPELQKFQRIKPGSTILDTLDSLVIEDPQHPPLYFLMARFWMQIFGSSLTASRSLPALLSLLALPFMYWLGLELFSSRSIALLATVLLALSPFDILFAQTARQYSLLTVMIIGSSFLLLKAIRLPAWRNWGLYTEACAIGLYTHPFFGLTLIGHLSFVICQNLTASNPSHRIRNNLKFFLTVAIAIFLYLPWLIVLKNNYQRMSDTTNWTKLSGDFVFLVKQWVLSFTALFLDVDLGYNSVWDYLVRVPVLLLIFTAIYTVCRQTDRTTWLFILTSIIVPFAILAIPDLLLGGMRSAVSRYLISCYPGVQLAVAYFLANKISEGKQFWRGAFALLLTGSIASCSIIAFYDTWWNKDLSYFNAQIARIINATSSPIVLSDIGDDYTNTGDLISLSYLLDKDVKLLLVSQPPDLKLLQGKSDLFAFRPSAKLRDVLESDRGKLELVSAPGRLWRSRQNTTILK